MGRKSDLITLARFHAKVLGQSEQETLKELDTLSTKQIRKRLAKYRKIQLLMCEQSYRKELSKVKNLNEMSVMMYALLGMNSFLPHDTIQ